MKKYTPTFKQLARSAGYYAYKQFSSGGDSWRWHDFSNGSKECSDTKFSTEAEAYEDCCIKAGLVQILED